MEFINYLNLSDKKNGQAIYSSQLYGTFFSIYALIESDKIVKNSKTLYVIKQIKLFIINYKGNINLGITKAHLKPKIFSDFDARQDLIGAELKIELQGLHQMKSESFAVTIENGALELAQNAMIQTTRLLRPIHLKDNIPTTPENRNTPLYNNIFDSEFFNREGIIVDADSSRRNEFVASTWNDKNSKKDKGIKSGKLCPFSHSIIL